MTLEVDPESGLAFVELSHPWGRYTPIFHGYEEIKFERGAQPSRAPIAGGRQ